MVQGLEILKASLTSTFALTDNLKQLIRPIQENNGSITSMLFEVIKMILKMVDQVQFGQTVFGLSVVVSPKLWWHSLHLSKIFFHVKDHNKTIIGTVVKSWFTEFECYKIQF